MDSTDCFSAGNDGSSFGHGSTDRLDDIQFLRQDAMDDGQGSYSPSVSQRLEPPGKVPEGYSVEKSMDRAWMQMDTQPMQQFWEKGFWAEIFGETNSASASLVVSTLELHRPHVPQFGKFDVDTEIEEGITMSVAKRARHATYMDVVMQSPVQSWQEQRDSMWETAIRRWHSCILSWVGDDTVIGLIQGKADFKSQCQIIVDVLHNKAPATLLKRCNSVSRLVNELHKAGLHFPCTEEELYEHMCKQRSAGAPPSRLKSLLEAITFVRHIFGVSFLEPCTKSRRCMGVATPKQLEITKQAPPMRVDHLLALHHVMDSDEDDWNRAFVGMVLFCIYGRARWSDAQHSQVVEWDVDSSGQICYVECATAVHKTCRALNMRLAFLPLTAPGLGIGEHNWAEGWKTARANLCIDDLATYPLMPSPDDQGQATVRPLSTQEAGKWLNLLLKQKTETLGVSEALQYTSHSFKATTLSYLAKYGCSFEDRLALGYHVDQVRMALRYSRDGASRPLRILEACLTDIRLGKFKPDETRSGRFVNNVVTSNPSDVPATVDDTRVKHEVLSSATGVFEAGEVIEVESDHATTCSESSSGDDAVVMPKLPQRTLLIPRVWTCGSTPSSRQSTWHQRDTSGSWRVAAR